MSSNVDPSFEEGEIEDDLDSISNSNYFGETIRNVARNDKSQERVPSLDNTERESSDEVPRNQFDSVDLAELSEYEMLYMRGASPLKTTAVSPTYNINKHFDEMGSSEAHEGWLHARDSLHRKKRRKRSRSSRTEVKDNSPLKKSVKRRYQSENNEEPFSDKSKADRMEICKFYLLDCCTKRIDCHYMHSDFPCKYFHLGINCQDEKDCKFNHGEALSAEIASGLARHIASAPKHILGNFKRYGYDKALSLIEKRNGELSSDNKKVVLDRRDWPSPDHRQSSKCFSSKTKSPQRLSLTAAQEWANDAISSILSVPQKEKIAALGITNWLEVKHLTLAQLTTDIGLSLLQIGEIHKVTASDENGSSKSTATALVSNDGRHDDVGGDNWDCEVHRANGNDEKNWCNDVHQAKGEDEENWDDEVHQADGSTKSTATTLVNNDGRRADGGDNWDCRVHRASSNWKKKTGDEFHQAKGGDEENWDEEVHQANGSAKSTATTLVNNDGRRADGGDNWDCGVHRVNSNGEKNWDDEFHQAKGDDEEEWYDEDHQAKGDAKSTAAIIVSSDGPRDNGEENWDCQAHRANGNDKKNWDDEDHQAKGDDEENWDDEVHQANSSAKSIATTLGNNDGRHDDGEENWDCEVPFEENLDCEVHQTNLDDEKNLDDEVYQVNGDADMVQLIAIESKAVCSQIKECSTIDQVDEATKLHTISEENANVNKESIRAETKPNSDWMLDDESILVIDEKLHEPGDSDIDENVVVTETCQPTQPDSIKSIIDKSSLDTPIKNANSVKDKDNPTTDSVDDLFDVSSQNDLFKSKCNHPEIIAESQSNNFVASENASPVSLQLGIPALSDFDLRLPFDDVIVNHAVALEIDAHYKPYRKIPYRLIEILLPETVEPAIRPENTTDPRIKKLLYSRGAKYKFTPSLSLNLTSERGSLPVDRLKSELAVVDPRNQNASSINPTTKPIQQNFNFVLNHYLQKSMWYLNQSSKAKMEINEHLYKLVSELNTFSLNTSRNRHFQISSMPNAAEIGKVLHELGLEVNGDGIIQETVLPKSFEMNQPNSAMQPIGTAPLQTTNWPQNSVPLNTFQYPHQNYTVVPNFCLSQNFGFPKPGLLGIAPGFDYSGQKNNNNWFAPPNWNEYTPDYGMNPNRDYTDNGSCNSSNFQQMCNQRNSGQFKKKRPRRK